MELDFDTVKALSSRTRIKILNETISGESTPTDISNSIGRSKSTVSSHLSKLQKANLVEKEEVEGRRRVVYRPTDKTKTILNGRDKKVKFSILSSVSTAWIGAALVLNQLQQKSVQAAEKSTDMGAMTMNQGVEAASESAGLLQNFQPVDALLLAGAGFLSISVGGLMYGFVVSRLRDSTS